MSDSEVKQDVLFRTDWQVADTGVERRLVAVGESLTAMEVRFEPGATGSMHSHPNEQVSHVLEGRFTFRIDGRELEVKAGDTLRIPRDLEHGVTAHEQGRLLDVFTPPREDLLAVML
ncbi:MAG: cupin domain-containing protein [Trueperaceae bacterium]